ncbi:hypothetical protein GWO13_05480 [Candidatus Bathyarchaeota archaeon]|nr:hypothetical protein [Candidatus Bathyarchaeota archaeon]
MRLNSVCVVLGILLLVVFGTQLLAPSIGASSIEAWVEIKPETLNLKKNGVVTVFIELPSPYNVSDVNVDAIKLHVEDGEDYVVPTRCVAADGKLIVKFDASDVADYILGKLVHMQVILPKAKYPIDLVVEGMVNGEHFEGDDKIRIILP